MVIILFVILGFFTAMIHTTYSKILGILTDLPGWKELIAFS